MGYGKLLILVNGRKSNNDFQNVDKNLTTKRVWACLQYFYLFNHGSYERKRLYFEPFEDFLDQVNTVYIIACLSWHLKRCYLCIFKHPLIIEFFVIFEDVRSCHDLRNDGIEQLSNWVYWVDLPVLFMTLSLDF